MKKCTENQLSDELPDSQIRSFQNLQYNYEKFYMLATTGSDEYTPYPNPALDCRLGGWNSLGLGFVNLKEAN